MLKPKKYSTYDPRVKALIVQTKRTDLFPQLKIPRTTALHWIKQGYESEDPLLDSLAETVTELSQQQVETQKLLLESKATTQLLRSVYETLGYRLVYKRISSDETRNRILSANQLAMKNARRKSCLEVLGMTLSRYKRWKREKRGCELLEIKFCPKQSPNQLTFTEIQLMREFITSPKYSHFPVRSLMFYTRRKGLLFCSYSTWRKYIDEYEWLRPRKKKHKKAYGIGIRAKHPNEIWHMDVSYFIFPDGSKAFIQAVIDNYSRYVLAWQILDSFDGAKTTTLLEQALKKSTGRKLRLIVDGGTENKGPGVSRLERRGAFKKRVARFEISFSNSIVEALFRQLKHNYLFNQKITSLKLLTKHSNFWFKEHNEVVPHTSFKGETPQERFKQSWSKEKEVRILVRHEEAIQLRIQHNQEIFCARCE